MGREAPIHGDSQLVAPFLPGGGLRAQRLRVRDPFGQGLAFEGIDFREPCGRGNIEPAGMLGGVDPLQTARDAPGRGGLIALVQDTGFVRVEVVTDQGNPLAPAESVRPPGPSGSGRNPVWCGAQSPPRAASPQRAP